VFAGFDSLTSVVITTTHGSYPILDNITLDVDKTSIPVLATLRRVGLGLLGLGLGRRKHELAHVFWDTSRWLLSRHLLPVLPGGVMLCRTDITGAEWLTPTVERFDVADRVLRSLGSRDVALPMQSNGTDAILHKRCLSPFEAIAIDLDAVRW